MLLAAQVAVCVLLAGATLLVKTFERMRSMNPGFDQAHIVTFTIDPGMKGYKPEQAKLLSRKLLEETRTLRGVVAAAIASHGLMRGTGLKGMRIRWAEGSETEAQMVWELRKIKLWEW